MPVFADISSVCEKEAKEYGQLDVLKNLQIKVERDQGFKGLFTSFSRMVFWKKNLGRSFRLLAYAAHAGENELLVFCRCLPRSSAEYDLISDAEHHEELLQLCRVPCEADIQAFVERRRKGEAAPLLPAPSEEEMAWLYPNAGGHLDEEDDIVLESREWIEASKGLRDWLVKYREILERIVSGDLGKSEVVHGGCVREIRDGSFGILYVKNNRCVLLLEPFKGAHAPEGKLEYYRKIFGDDAPGKERLERFAKRAYPAFAALDDEIWLEIQKDDEANLSLSPEEAELLDAIRSGARDTAFYPLFINGRAGSGKSTMLQYLMADYMGQTLACKSPLMPLYMTCGDALLSHARKRVERLLTVRVDSLMNAQPPSAGDMEKATSKSFVLFREHLLGLLPEERRSFFDESRRVGYGRFQKMWLAEVKHPEALKVGPELAWHTIRTYIKGRRPSLDDYLKPEQFRELPRKNRSVGEDVYGKIFEHVWESWYKNRTSFQEHALWDDQDLAAEVLYGTGIPEEKRYPAIFCDEAQDFTPLELEIVVLSSLFAYRKLYPEELRRVPFVFAGDPLQTVNPTGFRWESLRADFHEKFSALIDSRDMRDRVALDYKELTFNYRSNKGIVHFGNTISLLRKTLLKNTDTNPQESWWPEAIEYPLFFDVDDPHVREKLLERSDMVKIVNCEEGEESSFAKKDDLLKRMDEMEGVFRNILSPARAKGLEFSEVVLYRFGENIPKDFEKRLSQLAGKRFEGFAETEERLPFEYFLNRLYVGASRAKKKLFILDSKEVLEGFWSFSRNTEILDGMLELLPAQADSVWKERMCSPLPGNTASWAGERVDPTQQAKDYEKQGFETRDGYFMRQAAISYRNVPDEGKAVLCTARAHEFDENLLKAGETFEQVGYFDEALRCYWKGRHFAKLVELAAGREIRGKGLEVKAAAFMSRSNSGASFSALISGVLEIEETAHIAERLLGDATWRFVLEETASILCSRNEQSASRENWEEATRLFEKIAGLGFQQVGLRHRGLLAKRGGNLFLAAKLWDQCGYTGEEVFRVHAEIDPFPLNLQWLLKLKETRRVLESWRIHGSPEPEKLPQEVPSVLFEAAMVEKDLKLAVEALGVQPDKKKAILLLQAAFASKEEPLVLESVVLLIRGLVRENAWESVVQAVESMEFPSVMPLSSDHIKEILMRRSDAQEVLLDALIREFFVSGGFFSERFEKREVLVEYLVRVLLNPWRQGDRFFRHIPAECIGAFWERLGRHGYALQFYQNGLEKGIFNGSEMQFAQERYVKTLEKFGQYLISRGEREPSSEEGGRSINEGTRLLEKAFWMRQEYGLGDRELEEFPPAPHMRDRLRAAASTVLGEEAEKPADTLVFGPLCIRFSADGKKARVEHGARFETVTIYPEKREIRGDAVVNMSSESSWDAPEWGMKIDLSEDGTTVELGLGQERFRFSVHEGGVSHSGAKKLEEQNELQEEKDDEEKEKTVREEAQQEAKHVMPSEQHQKKDRGTWNAGDVIRRLVGQQPGEEKQMPSSDEHQGIPLLFVERKTSEAERGI